MNHFFIASTDEFPAAGSIRAYGSCDLAGFLETAEIHDAKGDTSKCLSHGVVLAPGPSWHVKFTEALDSVRSRPYSWLKFRYNLGYGEYLIPAPTRIYPAEHSAVAKGVGAIDVAPETKINPQLKMVGVLSKSDGRIFGTMQGNAQIEGYYAQTWLKLNGGTSYQKISDNAANGEWEIIWDLSSPTLQPGMNVQVQVKNVGHTPDTATFRIVA